MVLVVLAPILQCWLYLLIFYNVRCSCSLFYNVGYIRSLFYHVGCTGSLFHSVGLGADGITAASALRKDGVTRF